MAQSKQRSQEWQAIAGDVVVSFVDAINNADTERLVDLFATDAHVNDQLRDFWGKAAIGNWVRREIVGERLHVEVLEARGHFGDLILSANVSGDFDKTGLPDPSVLNFIFSFSDGKVARLIILMTRPGQTEPEVRKIGSE
ncbi:MAG: nuclear transport factor 2 family protein [Pseudomonadota bacterium]